MAQRIFVIKDEQTGGFQSPVVMGSNIEMIRSLTVHLRESNKSMLAQFPQYYSVWCIAEWDGQKGILSPLFDKEHIINIIDILNMEAANGSVQ